jgi:hypothetical protein
MSVCPIQNFYLAMTSLVFLSSVVQLRARARTPSGLSPIYRLAAEGAVRLLYVYSTCERGLLDFAPFMLLLLTIEANGGGCLFNFFLYLFGLFNKGPRL